MKFGELEEGTLLLRRDRSSMVLVLYQFDGYAGRKMVSAIYYSYDFNKLSFQVSYYTTDDLNSMGYEVLQ